MTASDMATTDVAITAPAPVVSVKPVALEAPGRGEDLRVRVSAPTTGSELPVVVFSHGFGSSLNGYGPLADFWAAHGFVVIQPTHLDSRTVGLPQDDPRTRGSGVSASRTRSGSSTSSICWKPPFPDSGAASTEAASPRPATPSAARRRAICWACASSIR